MIHVVIGTKAQMIKMAPVMAALEERCVPWNFIFTGQHRETIDALRRNFNVREPDVVLYEGHDITSVPAMTAWTATVLARGLVGRSDPFRGDRDGIVLVHGDTASCLLGAVMARAHGQAVGHVEAGLRSHRLLQPFPEELVRVATSKITDLHFCPGRAAVRNVADYPGVKVNTVYNTLLDALRTVRLDEATVEVPDDRFCLVSVHRFENIYSRRRMEWIVSAIEEIGKEMGVLFILHPPTLAKLHAHALFDRLANNPAIQLRPRYDYPSFIKLLHRSEFLVTDGGSNQEECFYMGKPCLLVRDVTERPDGLGRNTVLSRYDRAVVRRFLTGYGELQVDSGEFTTSPTRIIVDTLVARVRSGRSG